MKGLLFYDTVGAERNKWFIARMIEVAKERDCELKLVIAPDEVEDALASAFDFAIVRTISPKLNKRLEGLNIPTFNNSKTSFVANDKWQTYHFAQELGLSVMNTQKITDKLPTLPYPYVIKTVDGHGGSEVFMVKNEDECKELLSLFKDRELIAQSVCNEPGIDMRVYVLGDEILAAVKRSSETDFRSNFSLGGNAELSLPDEKVKRAVRSVCASLGCDLVGIDFIRHNGEWILNEIEDVVGTRMLYALTDIDAAKVYVEYILSKVNS